MIRQKMIAALFFFALGLSSAMAQTLQEAVDLSLKTYPQILSQEASLSASTDQVRQAEGGYYPKLNVGGGIGREDSNNPGTRAIGSGHSVVLTRKQSDFLIQQLLFDGGQVKSEVDQNKAGQAISQFSLIEARELLAFQAAEAYLNVKRARELVAIQEQDVKSHADVLDKMQRLLAGGAGLKSDVALAQGRLAQAKAELISASSGLADAEAIYLQTVGVKPDQKLPLPSEPEHFPLSLEVAQQKAYLMNPLIAEANSVWQKAVAQIHQAKSNFYPLLTLDLSGELQDNIEGIPGPYNEARAMVDIKYNLFNGGSDRAGVDAARALALAAERDKMTITRQVANDIALSWDEYLSDQNQLPDLELHQADSYKVTIAYAKQFKVGQRTLFDLLNAASEYFDAQTSTVMAKYDLRIAQYRLLASVGDLVNTVQTQNE